MQKTPETIDKILAKHVYEDSGLETEDIVYLRDAYLEHGAAQDAVHPTKGKASDFVDWFTLMMIRSELHNLFDSYSPDPKKAFEDQAEVVPVKVGDRKFDAFIDEHGTLRFKTQTVFNFFMKLMSENRMIVDGKPFTLNEIAEYRANGVFSDDDWLTFYTSFGYSLGGFCDLSDFQHLRVETPDWYRSGALDD